MPTGVGIAAIAAALGVVSAAPGTPVLWVELAPDLRCPPPSSVVPALEERLAADRLRHDTPPEGALTLRVAAHGPHGVTVLLLSRGEVLVERTIDVAAEECPGLSHTLALIAEAWLPMATETREDVPSPQATQAAAAPSKDTNAAPEPAPVPTTVAKAAAASTAPPRPAAPPSRDVPSTDAHTRVRHFRLEAAIGAAIPLESGSEVTGLLRLSAEGALGRWLAGLRGNFETAGDLRVSPPETGEAGAISTRRTAADVFLGCKLHDGTRMEIAVLVSAGLDFVSAHVSGYSDLGDASFVDPEVGAGARAAWLAFGDVAFSGGLDATYAWRRETFVSGGTSIAALPHFRTRLVAGVSWSPF